jgi:hypothetical protein
MRYTASGEYLLAISSSALGEQVTKTSGFPTTLKITLTDEYCFRKLHT